MSLLHCSGLQPSCIEVEIKTLEHSGQQEPSFHAFFCPFITLCRFITLGAWCLQTVSETVETIGWNFQRHTSSSWFAGMGAPCWWLNLSSFECKTSAGLDLHFRWWNFLFDFWFRFGPEELAKHDHCLLSELGSTTLVHLSDSSNVVIAQNIQCATGISRLRFGLSHWEIQEWVCLDRSEIRFQTSIWMWLVYPKIWLPSSFKKNLCVEQLKFCRMDFPPGSQCLQILITQCLQIWRYRLEIALAILTTRNIQDRLFLIHQVRHDKCHITWQARPIYFETAHGCLNVLHAGFFGSLQSQSLNRLAKLFQKCISVNCRHGSCHNLRQETLEAYKIAVRAGAAICKSKTSTQTTSHPNQNHTRQLKWDSVPSFCFFGFPLRQQFSILKYKISNLASSI